MNNNEIFEIELENAIQEALDNNPRLLFILRLIHSHRFISGPDLRAHMKGLSSSSLSLLIKQVNKYDIIDVRKIGTTNYYSLTVKGKNALIDHYIAECQNSAKESSAQNRTEDKRVGEWKFRPDISIGGGAKSDGYVCSECGCTALYTRSDCPRCRVKMKGRKND